MLKLNAFLKKQNVRFLHTQKKKKNKIKSQVLSRFIEWLYKFIVVGSKSDKKS